MIYTEKKAEDFLRKYMPVARSYMCKNRAQAAQAAKKLGFPVVMKIISSQALHKTEIGGVRIAYKETVEKEFSSLTDAAKMHKIFLEGILVQEYVKGTEIAIGIKKDETFGHVIMLGMGGIFIELIKDVSFRVCPIDEKEAVKMMQELKAGRLIFGYRGKSSSAKELARVIAKVSCLPVKNKKIKELDINPFIINETHGKVADARIVFE